MARYARPTWLFHFRPNWLDEHLRTGPKRHPSWATPSLWLPRLFAPPGETPESVAGGFDRVYTIESDEDLFAQARHRHLPTNPVSLMLCRGPGGSGADGDWSPAALIVAWGTHRPIGGTDGTVRRRVGGRLGRYGNIQVLHGNSSAVIPAILKMLREPAFFWLHAHDGPSQVSGRQRSRDRRHTVNATGTKPTGHVGVQTTSPRSVCTCTHAQCPRPVNSGCRAHHA